MTRILVTGAAGFIGYHACEALLASGRDVIGIDNFEPYYDPGLKHARLAQLENHPRFTFLEGSITDENFLASFLQPSLRPDEVLHLAAQAGVRYSLEKPMAYADSNLVGHLRILELCRALPSLQHLVYASSSSVYGGLNALPYRVGQPIDKPVSLYAASKAACEAMSYSYSHLYGIPATGLRFFTVYGPWGRPDMAYYQFTRAILNGDPITLFNHGEMRRDFTFIDDIVMGILLALDNPPIRKETAPHALYNLGRGESVVLGDFVTAIEKALQCKAVRHYAQLQPGDVIETLSDITLTQEALGYQPRVSINEGIPQFVDWYRCTHG